MQQQTRIKEAETDLGLALVMDTELFRLDSVIRWLDYAGSRIGRAAADPRRLDRKRASHEDCVRWQPVEAEFLAADARSPRALCLTVPSGSGCVEQAADDGDAEAGDDHLQALLASVADHSDRLVRADAEKHRCACDDSADERRGAGCPGERQQQRDHVPDQRSDRDHDRAAEKVRGLNRLQVQLLVHRRGKPGVPVGGDGVHHLFEQMSVKPLAA